MVELSEAHVDDTNSNSSGNTDDFGVTRKMHMIAECTSGEY